MPVKRSSNSSDITRLDSSEALVPTPDPTGSPSVVTTSAADSGLGSVSADSAAAAPIIPGIGRQVMSARLRGMYELLTLERRDDGVAVVTLRNGKVNALSTMLLGELESAVSELSANLPGAVVVTGGDRIFAAGADINEFGGQAEARRITDRFHATNDAIAALDRFVIASVSGYALGGGCELALACDYRIAGPRAVFGQPETLLGIVPGGGGTLRLARLVGPSRAKELCITGRQVAAEEAVRIGLADEHVDGDPHERALALAAEIARGAVLAQALCKRVIDRGLSLPLADGLALERDAFVDVFGTADSQIGVASFREQGPGKATFTGR